MAEVTQDVARPSHTMTFLRQSLSRVFVFVRTGGGGGSPAVVRGYCGDSHKLSFSGQGDQTRFTKQNQGEKSMKMKDKKKSC